MVTSSSSSSSRVGFMEEALIVSGLIAVQIIFAFYILFLHGFLSLGVNSLSLVILGGLASALLLLPFAVVLERKKWPVKLKSLLMVQMLLIAITGVVFQALMMYGIKMTSPAIASSMPNLAPAFIFIIATCTKLEKFSIRCKYSRAKVVGTVLCLIGAISMSFLMSPAPSPNSPSLLQASSLKDWMLGCLFLLLSIISLSCSTVLQATTMVKFQAPLSLCAITTLMGSIFTAMLQFVMQGDLSVGSSSLSLKTIVGLVLLGAVVTSVCVGFQTWCVKKKGPVMVSIFNPVQTVFSAILSSLILGQVINSGSLGGMLVMFVGLYIVLWAKKKEDCDIKDGGENTTGHDIEKPLLS